MASAETGLGLAFLGQGRPRDALPLLESALAARAARTTPAELVGETRFAPARALWADPAQRGRAASLARAARADYAGADGQAMVAVIDDWLRAVRDGNARGAHSKATAAR